MTVSVSLDIAGFYYRRDSITVANNATIRDVMDEARRLDLAAFKSGATTPVLDYTPTLAPDPYMQTITVHHLVPATSRQKAVPPRQYPVGEYSFRSDGVIPTHPPELYKPFTAVNLQGEEITRPVTVSWQYYLYDANGVEEARRFREGGRREIIPFSKRDRSNMLTEGCTIVWRAVVVMIAPTRPKSLKGAVAAM